GLGSLFLGLSSTAMAGEGEWDWFPVMGDDYVMEPTASVIVGNQSFDDGGSDSVMGIELSFNCPMLKPPTNKIRQQVSMTKYDDSGVEVTSIELNPHYLVEMSPGLLVGGGPGLGYVAVDTRAGDDNLLTFQLGASVHYNVNETFFLGGDARYQIAGDADLAGTDVNMNNWRVGLKAGVNF
ncbi:MAG TPA: hypothetical protein ENJ65_00400, partial [Candidatus Tenderia electrophaga]|nr:hypothetical protein [Candidatus Tenderia electrophaga]